MALRLIALFKLIKGLLLVAVGFGALRLLHTDLSASVALWADRLSIDPQNRWVAAALRPLMSADTHRLAAVAAGSFVYAAVLTTEGVGLWLRRRWAEYFTIIVTSSFIPLELYEGARRLTPIRLAVIALNVVIVLYLVSRRRAARRRLE